MRHGVLLVAILLASVDAFGRKKGKKGAAAVMRDELDQEPKDALRTQADAKGNQEAEDMQRIQADGMSNPRAYEVTSEAETDALGSTQLAALAATLAALFIGILIIGAPLWRDFMAAREKSRAKAREASSAEEATKLANAWLAKKEQLRTEQTMPPSPPSRVPPPEAAVCWGCGVRASDDATFKACAKCVQQGIHPPCLFCSATCMKTTWPRHKQWHVEEQRRREALESERVRAAIQTIESCPERIAVPAKRPTKRNKAASKSGVEEVAAERAGGVGSDTSASEYESQLAKAERQQADRERTQLSTAFTALAAQLERDNGTATLAASRTDFGKLITQIDELLGVVHDDDQVDSLFALTAADEAERRGREYADQSTVDLKTFLHANSTLEWFLAAQHEGREKEAPKKEVGVAEVEQVD